MIWFTISKQHEDGEIHSPLPARVLLNGDAVASGGEHLAAPNGDQLTALVSARHVVEHRSVVDEGIQFAAGAQCKGNVSQSVMEPLVPPITNHSDCEWMCSKPPPHSHIHYTHLFIHYILMNHDNLCCLSVVFTSFLESCLRATMWFITNL